MKKFSILMSLLLFTIATKAQTPEITGSWLMTKVEVGNEILEPFFITDFNKNGKMMAMGMEVGSWTFNKKSKKLVLKSEIDNDFNGEADVLKLNSKELIVKKDEAKITYVRVDKEEIKNNNKKINLIGVWRVENENNGTVIIKFDKPDAFLIIEDDGGVTSRAKGEWIYLPEKNAIIVIGFMHLLRGKSEIVKLTSNEVLFNNNGTIVKAKREDPNKNKIERLTFEYENFSEEDNCEANLPWIDFEKMAMFLKNIKAIKYRVGSLLEEVNTLKYSTIVSTIKVKPNKPSVMFTNFSIENGDSMQYSQNYKGGLSGRYNNYFPKENPGTCRFVGIEKVTVPAGTFECTVIEGFDGDKKIKYWLINNKPGIYAKTIREGENVLDDLEYIITELEEIEQ